MGQRHFIGKLNLDFHSGSTARGPDLQEEASLLVREALIPALEQLFDNLAPAAEIIRLERLDIVLPSLDKPSWQADFIPSICRAVEKELERLIFHSLPSDAGLLQRQTVAEGLFEAWLYFLTTGQQSATASAESDWQQAALETVATEVRALEKLRALLQSQPRALERLVRQHDETFLVRLAEAMSGQSLRKLPALQQAVFTFFSHPKMRSLLLAATSAALSDVLPDILARPRSFAVFFYTTLFRQGLKTTQKFDIKTFTSLLLENTFNHPGGKSPAAFVAQLVATVPPKPRSGTDRTKGNRTPVSLKTPAKTLLWPGAAPGDAQVPFAVHETALLSALSDALASVQAAPELFAFFEAIVRRESSAISVEMQRLLPNRRESRSENQAPKPHPPTPGEATQPALRPEEKPSAEPDPDKTQPSKETSEPASKTENTASEQVKTPEKDDTPAGTSLVAVHAGVVILHPFLKIYFEKMGLLQGKEFVNAGAQRRAAQLVHYLATGETEAPEYDLPLAKILVGLPLDTPLDRTLDISTSEQQESIALLETVIGYWTSLGNCSPEALREGFLQRPGRLTRREDGWLLQPQTQALDILLDRLPWGIGMVKLEWMPEFLYVEWF